MYFRVLGRKLLSLLTSLIPWILFDNFTLLTLRFSKLNLPIGIHGPRMDGFCEVRFIIS